MPNRTLFGGHAREWWMPFFFAVRVIEVGAGHVLAEAAFLWEGFF